MVEREKDFHVDKLRAGPKRRDLLVQQNKIQYLEKDAIQSLLCVVTQESNESRVARANSQRIHETTHTFIVPISILSDFPNCDRSNCKTSQRQERVDGYPLWQQAKCTNWTRR
jgi:hypothetical protein